MSLGGRRHCRAIILVCAAGLSGPAGAADWSINSRIAQTFRISDDSKKPGVGSSQSP